MAARLVFLSGSKSGSTVELGQGDVSIGRRPDRTVAFSADDVIVSTEHATVRYREGRYILHDDGSRNGTFVNSQRVTERQLEHGDLIQFGPGGPAARFVLEAKPGQAVTVDIAAQTERRAAEIGAVSQSGSPVLTTRDLVAVTYYKLTRRIRGWVLLGGGIVVLAIAGLVVWQWRSTARTERELNRIATALATSRAAIAEDLAELENRFTALRDVLITGERNAARVLSAGAVNEFSRGVILISVTYGFTRSGSTGLLRYKLDPQGQVVMTGPAGRQVPSVTFGGAGAPVQLEATATGFVVDPTGYVFTSRRASEPWLDHPQLQGFRSQELDLTGQIIEARAYFPPGDRSMPLVLHRRSDVADVAVLRIVGRPGIPFLPLAADSALTRPEDPVFLIGYPDDVRSLLVRVDTTERNDILRSAGGGGRRALLEELGRRQLIRPLFSEGRVTTTTAADFAHTNVAIGGAGGPLIDARRRVIGVELRGSDAPSGPPALRGARVRYAFAILPAHVQRTLEPRR
jgi:hypothetical protein